MKRYDVLDFNNSVIYSTDSWGLAVAALADWETISSKGAIRDNDYYGLGGAGIVKDNRDLSGRTDYEVS